MRQNLKNIPQGHIVKKNQESKAAKDLKEAFAKAFRQIILYQKNMLLNTENSKYQESETLDLHAIF